MDWNQLTQKLMVPPGEGVYTVNTAKERKQRLQELLYPEAANARAGWEQSLEQIKTDRPFLFGLCSDTGGGILRGANWGPLFLRLALKEDFPHLKYHDLGDCRVVPHLLHDKYLNPETLRSCRQALYQNPEEPLPVAPLAIAEHFLRAFYQQYPEAKVLSLGGDHSVSYAFTKPYLEAKRAQGIKVGLLHFDAHTDLLTERLGIDLCFASWCTAILDDLASPNLLTQVGIRSSAKKKEHWEKTFGVVQHWGHEVQQKGAGAIAEELIAHYKKHGVQELYVSFDIDAIDEEYAGATGTPEPNGLMPDQAALILTMVGEHFPITGADMVEVAPFLKTHPHYDTQESTLRVAASLMTLMLQAMGA